MNPRDTSTGDVLEESVLPALKRGGYRVSTRTKIGTRPGGRGHFIDIVATDSTGRSILVSLKWQQTLGTAEQKVPFEVMSLAHALREGAGQYAAAYLVLGGKGWTLREFYTGHGLDPHLKNIEGVQILDMETFTAKANRGEL